MNNDERLQWVLNDEGLYNWMRSWKRSAPKGNRRTSDFIRENRTEIDECIRNVTTRKRPAHYLAYGH